MVEKKVSMTAVAAAAGVSITTVSHVFNGTRRVAAETREKILHAASELGYVGTSTMRSLRSGTQPAVGIVGPLVDNYGAADLLLQVSRAASDADISSLIMDSGGLAQLEERAVATLIARRVDGIIISPAPGWRRRSLRILRQHDVPFVVVDTVDKGAAAHQVGTDREDSARALTLRLLERGAVRVVLVAPDRRVARGSEFMRGFEAAHAMQGLAIDPDQFIVGSPSVARVERVIAEVFTRDSLVDAFVLGSSSYLAPFLHVSSWAGRSPLDDLLFAVYGDDPTRLPERAHFPRAVRPNSQIAEAAIELLQSGRTAGCASETSIRILPAAIIDEPSSRTHADEPSIAEVPAGLTQFMFPAAHGRRHAGWLQLSAPDMPGPSSKKRRAATEPHAFPPKLSLDERGLPDRYFPGLHVRPRYGWINDANAAHRINGMWHLFYQYNPTSVWHERIQWGHATSRDLLSWDERPAALSPRHGEADSAGCWSGCGFLRHGASTLVYSGITSEDGTSTTIIAESDATGSSYVPLHVAAGMPPVANVRAQRDPFIFTADGRTWAVLGGGYDDGSPALFLYNADKWHNWTYSGVFLDTGNALASIYAGASIWEVPRLIKMDTNWILIVSLWEEAESHMDHLTGVSCLIGDIDTTGGAPRFIPRYGSSLDTGPDFYSPHATPDGDRILLWAWSWEGAERTDEQAEASGYNGTLTFPRELELVGRKLGLRPARELWSLREEEVGPHGGLPRSVWLEADGVGYVEVRDSMGGRSLAHISVDGTCHLLIDSSILEVFHFDGVPVSSGGDELPGAWGPSYTQRLYPLGEFEAHPSDGVNLSAWRMSVPRGDARTPVAMRFASDRSH